MVKESTSIKKRRKNTAPTENEGETDIYTVISYTKPPISILFVLKIGLISVESYRI